MGDPEPVQEPFPELTFFGLVCWNQSYARPSDLNKSQSESFLGAVILLAADTALERQQSRSNLRDRCVGTWADLSCLVAGQSCT